MEKYDFIKTSKANLFAFGVVLCLISCRNINSEEINSNYFVNTLSNQEKIPVELSEGMIELKPDFLDFDNDLLVLNYQNEEYQTSIIVPAKNNVINKYILEKDTTIGKVPFVEEVEQGDSIVLNKVSLQFRGNEYLNNYNKFINGLENPEKFLPSPHSYVNTIYDFSEKTKYSQIAGYLLYNAYNLFKNENEKLGKEIEDYAKNHKGSFFEKINATNSHFNDNNEGGGDCISHSIDTIVIQRHKNTIFYPEYYVGKDVIVLVFWATWCGPCKPILNKLIELSSDKYKNKPVSVFAASIDDDIDRYIRFINDKNYQENLVTFIANQCMRKSYSINNIPQIYIYDFNGKLVSKNINIEEVENLIDSTLNARL